MRNKVKYILLILVAWNFSSCESFVEGFETDPNNPADASAEVMIQGIMVADMFAHSGDLNRLAGMWMSHFTGADRQYVNLDTWAGSNASEFDNTWGNLYSGVVAQARIVQEKTTVSNNIRLRGVAKVLEAHALGTITSLWGDVPNTQANNLAEFPNPAYDDQVSIYAYLQTVLTSAIADLGTATGSIPNDILFNGSVASWDRFAHSLKARYFLHTKQWANAEAEAALGIIDVSQELYAPFGGVYGGDFSPFYSFLIYDRAGYMGADEAYAAELLDPDDLSESGRYRGNAKTDEEARSWYNYLPYFEYYTAGYEPNYINDFDWGWFNGKFGKEFPLFTAGESLLIIAEARIRQNDEAGAIAAYNNYRNYLRTGGGGFWEWADGEGLGVQYDDYIAADFGPGGMVRHGQTTSAAAILYEIIEERYVAFVGELEAFNDWRRTNNLLSIPVKSGTQIPQRFLYPQVEVNANTSIPTPQPDYFVKTAVNQ